MERERGVFKQMEDLEGIFGRVDLLKIKRFNKEGISKEIQQVDIMDVFSEFTEDQIENILGNNVGFQLTEGCSNRCSFCYKQAEYGVSHEFTRESLKEFFTKYSKFFDKKKPMIFYKTSDPFDKNDLIKIYENFRQHQPEMDICLTTAVPEGSEENIIKMIEIWNNEGAEKNVVLRLSVHKHNYNRAQRLLAYGKEKIGEKIIDKYIKVEPRHKGTLSSVGHGLKYKDPTIDVVSPACMDGTIVTPKGIFSSCMVVPTKIDQSGERDIKISTDNYERSVVNFCERDEHFGFSKKDSLSKRITMPDILLPPITKSGSKDPLRPYLNINENVALTIARESYTLGLLLAEIEDIYLAQREYRYPNELIDEYFDLIQRKVDERKEILLSLSFDETDETHNDIIDLQLNIFTAYSGKLSYVLDLRNRYKDEVEKFSKIVREVNRMSFTELKEILE